MTRANVPGQMFAGGPTRPVDEADIKEATRGFLLAAEKIRPLYVLSDDFNRLIDLAEDPAADPGDVEAELQAVTRDIQRKAFGIAEIIRDRERYAADLKLEEEKLAAKRKVALHLAERLKDYALREMQVIGITRIDTGIHTLTVRANPVSCVVLDAALVPSEYTRTKIEVTVDRKGILDAFRATGDIPQGVSIERAESLRIS